VAKDDSIEPNHVKITDLMELSKLEDNAVVNVAGISIDSELSAVPSNSGAMIQRLKLQIAHKDVSVRCLVNCAYYLSYMITVAQTYRLKPRFSAPQERTWMLSYAALLTARCWCNAAS